MRALRTVVVAGVCLCLAGSGFAQPPGGGGGGGGRGGPGGGRGGPGGPGGMFRGGRMQSLMEDVFLLNRFVGLQLTDDQLTKILDTYAKVPPTLDEREAKLMEMRQRLLAGQALVAADMQAIRDLFQRGGPGGGPGGGQQPAQPPAGISPLAQALWDLCNEPQQASLLTPGPGMGGPGGGGGANPQQVDRNQTVAFLTQLNTHLDTVDEAGWPARRDLLAAAMAVGTGAPGSDERKNKVAMFAEFLGRCYQVTAAEFEQKKQELAADLEALMPQGGALGTVWAVLDPGAVGRAMDMSFLNPKAPGLLQEMKAARAKPAQ